MKIAVIGAGAMGCLYGAYLSQKNEVIMLDTNLGKVKVLNEKGISVIEENGETRNFKNIKAYFSIHLSVELMMSFSSFPASFRKIITIIPSILRKKKIKEKKRKRKRKRCS